jgi:hypothetical protein
LSLLDQLSRGSFLISGGGGGGGIDIIKLQNENWAHDDEIRAEHARDIEITTGTTDAAVCGWDLATRGQKLRSCAKNRALCTTKQAEQQVKKTQLQNALQNNPKSAKTTNQLKNVNANLANILKMDSLNNQLEQMVLDEAKQDWDWKTGIPAQIDVIKEQAKVDFVDL